MYISKEDMANMLEVAQNATVGPPIGTATFSRTQKDVVAWDFEADTAHAGDFQFFKVFTPNVVYGLLCELEHLMALKPPQDTQEAQT